MGQEFTGNNNRLAQPPKGNPDTGTPRPAPGKSTDGNSPSPATGTGTPAPARTTDGTKTGGTGTQKEKILPGVAPVKVDTPPLPETPKKRQTRKPRAKKKEEPQSFNAQQITALIVSISSIVASRPGLEMFSISEMEALQIATPLANMIAKNENLAVIGEHADAVALVTACMVIMAPRLILYFDSQKKKKENANGGVRLESKSRESKGSSGKPAGPSPAKPETPIDGLSSAIPGVIF